jgi:hypothetical protein
MNMVAVNYVAVVVSTWMMSVIESVGAMRVARCLIGKVLGKDSVSRRPGSMMKMAAVTCVDVVSTWMMLEIEFVGVMLVARFLIGKKLGPIHGVEEVQLQYRGLYHPRTTYSVTEGSLQSFSIRLSRCNQRT